MIRNRLFAGFCALAAIAASTAVARGQTTYTWNGGGTPDGNWTNAANWGGTAPQPGNPTPLIVLAGATNLTTTLDLLNGSGGGLFDVNSLTFAANAGAFTVNPTGTNVTTLQIGAGGISVLSNNNQTFAAPLAVGANQTWTNSGTGTFTASGSVNLNGNALTVAGAGTTQFTGPVTGGGTLTNNSTRTVLVSGGVALGSNLSLGGTGTTNVTGVISGGNGLTKTGTGTAILAGVNTFAGPLAVNQGTLVVNRPTAGATPMGTGAVNLGGGTLSLRANANPLTVTGFTQDVIASATDIQSPRPFGTSISLDQGPASSAGWVLFENNPLFLDVYFPTGPRPTGLPVGGRVVSASNPATTYQLAAYGTSGTFSNNSLYLSADTTNTGSLNIAAASQGSFQAVSALVTGGSGATTFNAVLRFSDGSTTTLNNLSAPDWFNANTPFAIANLGRMDRFDGDADTGAITNPRLFPVDIFLSAADQAKTLVGIDFTRTAGGRLNVFGLSGAGVGGATNYANAVNVTASSTIEMLNVPSLAFGPLSINGSTLTTVTGTATATTLSFAGTTLSGSPTFNVPTGQTLTLGAVDYASAAQTITKTGGGILTLDTAAANATAINTLAANGGTVNVTNGTAIGATPNLSVGGGTANLGPYTALNNLTVTSGTATLPNVTAINGAATISGGTTTITPAVTIPTATISGGTTNLTGGATITAATVNGGTVNLGGPSSAGRLAGTGGTIALGANTLTFGAGNQTDTFAGAFTGAGSVIKAGTGTQTLSGGSTYAGGTTITAGKVVSTRPGALGTGTITLQDGATVSLGAPAPAGALSVTGFGGNGAGWNLQGGPPTVASNVLTITDNAGSQARSAWFGTQVRTGPFAASFKYSDVTGGGADGTTFGFQSQSATALGGAGGGMGWSGITPSVALLINIYGPNVPGLALRANGATGTPYTPTGAINVSNSGPGNEITFDIVYDGTNVTVTLTQGANTFSTGPQPLNLTGAVGSTAWLGFTGGTGGAQAQQNISNFTWNYTGPTSPTYTNAVSVVAGASATLSPILATGVTGITTGNLTMGAGSTLNVQADPTSPADTAYTVTVGATTLNGAATFNVANYGTGGGTLTPGTIADGTGAGSLTKAGTGTMTLAGNNTYTGGTTVTAGTLRVTGQTGTNSGTGTGAVAVNGGTLDGTGRVGGATTVNNGGTLSPGVNRVGTLTAGGNVAVNSGGRFAAGVGATGTSNNLAIQGAATTVDFKTGAVLDLAQLAGFTNLSPGTYTLVSMPANSGANVLVDGVATTPGQVLGVFTQGVGATGPVTINPAGFTLAAGDWFSLSRTGDAVILSFTPVPEPATVLAICVAVLGLGLAARRVRNGRATEVTTAA